MKNLRKTFTERSVIQYFLNYFVPLLGFSVQFCGGTWLFLITDRADSLNYQIINRWNAVALSFSKWLASVHPFLPAPRTYTDKLFSKFRTCNCRDISKENPDSCAGRISATSLEHRILIVELNVFDEFDPTDDEFVANLSQRPRDQWNHNGRIGAANPSRPNDRYLNSSSPSSWRRFSNSILLSMVRLLPQRQMLAYLLWWLERRWKAQQLQWFKRWPASRRLRRDLPL